MSPTLCRKLLALMAAPLLAGSVSAAAPLPLSTLPAEVEAHGDLDHKQTFYFDAAKTQYAGTAYYYCDGDYVLRGYETAYFTIVQFWCP